MLLTMIAIQAAAAANPAAFDLTTIRRSTSACVGAACGTRPERSYRITSDPDLAPDQRHAALRSLNRECGITGLPVCPSNGRQVFSSGF